MFHKRNPDEMFPGAQPSAAPNQNSAAGSPVRPAGVREYAYTRPQTAQQQFVPPARTNNIIEQKNASTTNNNPTSNNEGQAMSTNENTPSTPANTSAPRAMDIPGTMPYGRPAVPSMPAYGTTSHAAYNPYGSGRKLIIGEGITMSGEIEHCDHLIVEGTVQATLKDAKLLDISEAGVFYGTVDIEEATIAGRFEGDININGRLTVKATGVITGSIRYKELAIEAGAQIEGTLSPFGPRKDSSVASADFSKGKQVAKQARESAQKAADQLTFGENKQAAAAQ